jgi:hypothetical protein
VSDLLRGAIATANGTNNWTSVDELFVNTGLSRSASDRPKFPDASSADSTIDAIKKYIGRIFVDGNVVSSGGGATVFALTGAVLCSNPEGTSTPSSDCVDQFNKLALKVKVSGGLDLTVQVGPANLEPLVLRVRTGKSLAVEVDLDAGQKALEFINQTLASRSPFNGSTVQASGRASVTLEKFGADDFGLSQAVLSPVAVTVTDQSGVSRRFNLESRSPTTSVRIEGPAHRGTVTVELGKATWNSPYRDLFGGGAQGPLDISVAGVGAQLKLEDGKGSSLLGVTLGNAQSFLAYGGRNFITADLNETQGRKFDVSWSKTAQGLSFVLTPGVDVKVYTGLAALNAATGGGRADPAFDDTTWQGTFAAQSGNPTVEAIPSTANFGGGVKLVNGTLTLKSNRPIDTPRTFNAGVCLGGGSGSSSRNPVLDAFAATNCP